MFARTLIVAGGLVLALAGAAAAQTVVTGTVTRVDQPAALILLQDGRMIRVPGGTVLINGQPAPLTTIQPGTLVAIHDGQLVTYRKGAYVPADPRWAPYEVSGRVVNIDSVDNLLVLAGLRAIALTPDMQVFQDGRQVSVDSVRPGGYVTVLSVTPIAFSGRNRDRVVTVAPAPATTVVTPAPSTPVTYSGTVARVDSNTIVLTDGRQVPTTAETVVLVNDQVVMIPNLTPGTQVVIYPNGQRVAVTPSQSVVTTPETRVAVAPPLIVPPEPVKIQGGLREYESPRQGI